MLSVVVVVVVVVEMVVVRMGSSLYFSAYRPGQTPVLLLLSMSDMWFFLPSFFSSGGNLADGKLFKKYYLFLNGVGMGGYRGLLLGMTRSYNHYREGKLYLQA